MEHKTRTRALSWLLSLAMVLSLMPGLSSTAKAKAAEDATWSENQNITADAHIGKLTVTANVTVTIAEDKTVTVYSGVDATGHTLTVEGPGTLIINGAKGSDGKTEGNFDLDGTAGGYGFTGNIIVDGATVTVTGGTGGKGGFDGTGGCAGGSGGNGVEGNVTVKSGSIEVTGGTGGKGGDGIDAGGSGGSGGVGVTGTVTVTGGSATLTGGIGGEAGIGEDGENGVKDKAVSGTITGLGEESDDGTAWTAVSGNTSDKRYVKVEAAASAVTPTVTISPAGAGTVTAANHPNLSNSWQLTATPATGYAFKEWTYTTPGGQQKDSNNQLSVNKSYYNNGTISGLTAVFEEGSGATDDTSTYTLTIPSTLTVSGSGWNATDGISATGTLADGKKLTVTASSDDEFALVSGENKVNYKLAASGDTDTTYDNATEKTTWEFATLSKTAATQTMGIVVENYSAKPAGTYTDTVTFTAKVEAVTAETALKPLLNETAAFGLELTKSGTKYSVTFSKANGSFTCTGIKVDDTVVTPKQVIDQDYDAKFEEDGNGYGALAKVANDRLIVWLLGKTDNSSFTMPISFTISTGEYSNNSVSSVKVNGGEVLSALTYVEPQVG